MVWLALMRACHQNFQRTNTKNMLLNFPYFLFAVVTLPTAEILSGKNYNQNIKTKKNPGSRLENLISYTNRNGKIECFEENSQGRCKNNQIYIFHWESLDVINSICFSQATGLRQPLIGGFSTCPGGKVKDTRGVCKKALKFRIPGRKPYQKRKMNLRRYLR